MKIQSKQKGGIMQNENYFSQIKPFIFGFLNMIPVLFLGGIVVYTGVWVTAESFAFWHHTVGYGFYHALVTASASELLSLAVIGYWKPAGGIGKTIRGTMILAAFCFIVIPASFKSVESFSGKLHLQPVDQVKFDALSSKVKRLENDKKYYGDLFQKTGKWKPAYNRVERELRDAETELSAFLNRITPDQSLIRKEKLLVWTCFGIRGFVQLLNWMMFHVLISKYLVPVFQLINRVSNRFAVPDSMDSNGSNNIQTFSNQKVTHLPPSPDNDPDGGFGATVDPHDSRESIVLKLITTKGGNASFRQIRESKKLNTADECRMILKRLVEKGLLVIVNPDTKEWDQIFSIQPRIRRVV